VFGRVPIARRNLLQDRRRAGLSIFGVAMALVLVLALDGVVAGSMRQVTAYLRSSPADVIVSQRGVRTMHMSQSVLREEVAEDVRATDGVAWAEPLRYAGSVLEAPAGRRFTYVFGYDVGTGRGGPRQILGGQVPGDREVLVDDVVSGELGVDVGDTVRVFGTELTVAGVTADATSIANTTVFLSAETFVELRGPAVAYVLVGVDGGTSAADLARRLSALPGTTAQTREEFSRQEGRLVADMAADVMRIMSLIGFAIALAVVGLTLFTSTLGRLREFGVLKALGISSRRLTGVVLAHAAWTVVAAVVSAIAITAVVGAGVDALTPNLTVVLTPASVVRTAVGAALVGALGAVVPLRRVARVDAATAFRRP
jgi:putative ABC transport system permease protein